MLRRSIAEVTGSCTICGVRVWPIAFVCVLGCSDKAPPSEPGIETSVVEVKPVAEAPKPPDVPPPPPPPPVVTPPPVKHVAPPPATHKAPAVKKTEPTGSAATPPQPDPNKPTLEQNPYLYK